MQNKTGWWKSWHGLGSASVVSMSWVLIATNGINCARGLTHFAQVQRFAIGWKGTRMSLVPERWVRTIIWSSFTRRDQSLSATTHCCNFLLVHLYWTW